MTFHKRAFWWGVGVALAGNVAFGLYLRFASSTAAVNSSSGLGTTAMNGLTGTLSDLSKGFGL
jgi:hypothetical protein